MYITRNTDEIEVLRKKNIKETAVGEINGCITVNFAIEPDKAKELLGKGKKKTDETTEDAPKTKKKES